MRLSLSKPGGRWLSIWLSFQLSSFGVDYRFNYRVLVLTIVVLPICLTILFGFLPFSYFRGSARRCTRMVSIMDWILGRLSSFHYRFHYRPVPGLIADHRFDYRLRFGRCGKAGWALSVRLFFSAGDYIFRKVVTMVLTMCFTILIALVILQVLKVIHCCKMITIAPQIQQQPTHECNEFTD